MYSKTIRLETESADWGQKAIKVSDVIDIEYKYSLIPMLLVVVSLAVFLIICRRFERFEWTILVLITLKYAMQTLSFFDWRSVLDDD